MYVQLVYAVHCMRLFSSFLAYECSCCLSSPAVSVLLTACRWHSEQRP
jgi:hypothetical protein